MCCDVVARDGVVVGSAVETESTTIVCEVVVGHDVVAGGCVEANAKIVVDYMIVCNTVGKSLEVETCLVTSDVIP